jgi:hypothetical protein
MSFPSRAAKGFPVVLLAVLAAGCATTRVDKDYAKWAAADPRSILIVPVVNNTVDVDAAAYFLSTVPIPVAERGYYVFPVNMVKRVLEDDGLADASLVHQADPMRLCKLFGSDAVLYITIQRWDAQYLVLNTTVTVELDYVVKDGKTGDTLWKHHEVWRYSSGSGGGGGLASLVAAIVDAAITKAAPNYMPLARQANDSAMVYPGPGFPAGPFRPEYRRDRAPAQGAAPEK